jgi:hypothetical protein
MKCTFAVLTLTVAAVAHGADRFGSIDQEAVDVSIISLIATPERFHGKTVRAGGAFRAEFEGDVLCLHVEDLKTHNGKNCVWLYFDYEALGATPKDLSVLNDRNVWIEGTYNKNSNGHRGCCSGSIEGIWRVELTPFQVKP